MLRAGPILQSNVYGWFERVDRGVYALTPRGQALGEERVGTGQVPEPDGLVPIGRQAGVASGPPRARAGTMPRP